MRPSDKGIIQVKILDNSNNKGCEEHCGEDWSAAGVIELARQSIRDRFGEGVTLEYIDLSQQMPEQFKEMAEACPMPVLMVNGKPRISGPFDLRQLLDVIETELEVSREP